MVYRAGGRTGLGWMELYLDESCYSRVFERG